MSSLEEIFSGEFNEKKFQIVENFFKSDDENLALKTDLSPEQIIGILQYELCDHYAKSKWKFKKSYKKYVTISLKEHNISKDRQSRGEMVEIFRSGREEEKTTIQSRIRNFLGI